MKGITQRFLEFYEYLIAEKLIKNATELNKLTGVSKSMISEMKKGRSKVGPSTIMKTISTFNQLNCNWLIYGDEQGKMLLSDSSISSNTDAPAIVTVDQEGVKNAVLVNIKAAAGYLNAYGDPEFITSLPAYNLPQLPKGDYRMFEVDGESMYPTLHHKDTVICQYAGPSGIKDNQLYVVVTKQHGLLVKRVFKDVKKNGVLLLKSDNHFVKDKFRDIRVKVSEEILEMWRVVRHIRDLSGNQPGIYSTIDEMKAMLALLEEQVRQSHS